MSEENNEAIDKYKKLKKEIKVTLIEVLIAAIIGICVSRFVITNTEVPSGSMIPTIEEHAMLFSYRLAYTFSNPERFDIVVFRHPDGDEKLLIKRVIGLPGETIKCENGHIYVDDKLLVEDNYLSDNVYTSDFGPYDIPDNCYFMLGDNRTNSLDARYWNNKFVNIDDIIGKALFEYEPEFKKLY